MGTILGVILGVVVLAVAIFVFIKLRKKPTPVPTPVPVIIPTPVVSPVVPDFYYSRATKYTNCQQESGLGNVVVRSVNPFDGINQWFVDKDIAYFYHSPAIGTTYDVDGEFTSTSCNG